MNILTLHDINGMADTDALIVPVDEARANFLLWLNDPGSADEWPWREPVGDDEAEEYPDNDDQIPF